MHKKTMSLGLASAVVVMLVAPTPAMTSSSAKTISTKATPSLERGSFAGRVRALSATRLHTKLILTVTVIRTTRVAFFVKPCRRTSAGLACDSAKQRRSDSLRIRPGRNRVLRRVDVRGTRSITCARVDVRERRAGQWRTIVPGGRGVVLCTS